jgi:hypothetical protein
MKCKMMMSMKKPNNSFNYKIRMLSNINSTPNSNPQVKNNNNNNSSNRLSSTNKIMKMMKKRKRRRMMDKCRLSWII